MSRTAVNRLLAELRSLAAHADVVILDAGDGTSPWLHQLWRAAHQVLLISTPETGAMKASYSAVKLAPWGDVDGKVRLVINRCEEERQAHQAGDRFVSTCRRFLGVNLCQPLAVVKRAASDVLLSDRTGTDRDDAPFKQSISLLAAEVLSSCLVLSSHRHCRVNNSVHADTQKNR